MRAAGSSDVRVDTGQPTTMRRPGEPLRAPYAGALSSEGSLVVVLRLRRVERDAHVVGAEVGHREVRLAIPVQSIDR